MHRDDQLIKQPCRIIAISISIALNCVLQLDTIATSLDIVIRKTIVDIKVDCKDALNLLNSCTLLIYSLIDDRINIKRVADHNGIVSPTNEIDCCQTQRHG
jgi:hypothetical protein